MSTIAGTELESFFMLLVLFLTTGAAVLLSLTQSRLTPEIETPPSDMQFLTGRRY